MKPNEKPNIKSFFNYASKLTTSKAPIDNDRSGHRSTLFASPPFKTTNCSNISSILNQITTTRTSQRPIYCISERKINEIGTGYINLDKKKKTLLKKEPQLLEKNDKKFMKDIENCINYFENKQEVDKNYHNEELVKKQIFEERKRHHSYNSFHEFNKEKNNKMSNLHDREKVLLNEINCHKAKEREYIKKISYYDGKTKKLQASLKERKKKASEAKFMYLKEQIMKENALGVLRNILEKFYFF